MKNVIKIIAGAFGLLLLTLAVHIYMVARPANADAQTLALARADFQQDIQETDIASINAWLQQQPGVVRAVCNADYNNVVFSYYPTQVDADALTTALGQATGMPLKRHIPTAEAMAGGCPVKAPSFFSRIFSNF
jgi:hypothetical protein